MSMQRVTLSLNLTALMLLASCSALSQQYPVKSVRIVTAGVGGAVDVGFARAAACAVGDDASGCAVVHGIACAAA